MVLREGIHVQSHGKMTLSRYAGSRVSAMGSGTLISRGSDNQSSEDLPPLHIERRRGHPSRSQWLRRAPWW